MFVNSQVVTTLKDTSKPVFDVLFPALTLCGTGVHLSNVERKLILDFQEWRLQENRNETTKDAIKKDTEEFMQTRFQIKPSQTEQEHPLNILDILDTMIAPDVDASVAANGVRENILACKQEASQMESTTLGGRGKREANCATSCSNPKFGISGDNCFYASSKNANYTDAVAACQAEGAQLATINPTEDEVVNNRFGLG